MCKGLGLGEKPAVAKSKLAVVKSYKNDFRDIDTKKLNIASNESTDILSKSSARVLLGSELRTKFRTWNCTGSKATDDMCHGACITSMQLPHDLLSPAALNTRISDVVYIVLNNPKTYDYMNVHNLNQPVMFEVPLYTNPDSGIFEVSAFGLGRFKMFLLYCIVHYSILMHCIILYCAVLCCIVL